MMFAEKGESGIQRIILYVDDTDLRNFLRKVCTDLKGTIVGMCKHAYTIDCNPSEEIDYDMDVYQGEMAMRCCKVKAEYGVDENGEFDYGNFDLDIHNLILSHVIEIDGAISMDASGRRFRVNDNVILDFTEATD